MKQLENLSRIKGQRHGPSAIEGESAKEFAAIFNLTQLSIEGRGLVNKRLLELQRQFTRTLAIYTN